MTDEVHTDKKTEDKPRGERGFVGEATAALTLKQMYHQAHFQRVDAEDKRNPNKKVWVQNPGAPSLKRFARKLVASGDTVAKDFFANKKGAKNAQRSEANIKKAMESGSATKLKKKASKK